MKELELWLDESGNFQPEEQVNRRLKASLVGGVLIERGALTEAEITQMTAVTGSEGFAHATDFGRNQYVTVVLPALKKICDRGGRLVYFENSQRISRFDNRELYLRLISRGLIQLLQQIAKDGDFKLDIYIALRVDVDKGHEIIDDEEYIRKLTLFMRDDRDKGILRFSDRCSINFSIMSARTERRLQIADYACNSRLTRDSNNFEGIRSQLYELFDEDYIYSFKVETSEQRVQAMLAAGDISSAFVELYAGYGELDHKTVFEDVMERFRHLSYRLKRLHLNQFVSEVVTCIRSETDLERGEAIVKTILDELIPEITGWEDPLQTDEALFRLNAWLLDMYLREGDVIRARPVLETMDRVIRSMNYRVENLNHLYLFNDRKALFETSCMEFEKAANTMDRSINILKNVVEAVKLDDGIRDYFGDEGNIGSEMLGNAYCMKIFALMFLQSSDESLYEKLRNDTELALEQYRYEGELERIQQYRAHIEMVQGNYSEALGWLLKTKRLKADQDDVRSKCVDYLNGALDEDYLSRAFYLMYYTELMLSAYEGGDHELSEDMYAAIDQQGQIKEEFLLRDSYQTDIRSDRYTNPEIHRDILQMIFNYESGVYHPLEIIHWKYALYLHKSEKGRTKVVKDHFDWALDICRPEKEGRDYLFMRITALAVSLDLLVCLSEDTSDIREYKKEVNRLIKRIDGILKMKDVPGKMADYASNVKEYVNTLAQDRFMDEDQIERARKLSGIIAW